MLFISLRRFSLCAGLAAGCARCACPACGPLTACGLRRSVDDLHALLVGQRGSLGFLFLGEAVVLVLVVDIGAIRAVHHFQFGILRILLHVAFGFGLALVENHLLRLLERHLHRVHALGKRRIELIVMDIGPEAAGAHAYRLALKLAQGAGQLEQVERLFERDGLIVLVLAYRSEGGLLLVLGGDEGTAS